MRRLAPILVLLAALGVYAARGSLLAPFFPSGDSGSRPGASSRAGAYQDSELSSGLSSDFDAVTASVEPYLSEPVRGKIGRNSSLYVELRKAGVSPIDIDAVVRACRNIFDLRRVRSGQTFEVRSSEAHGLESFSLNIDSERNLHIHREGESFAAAIDTLSYKISYHVTQGTIDQSVFATLQEQGAETELASELAEIFGWTINFFTDIRRGDAFAVLYERRTYETGRTLLGNVLAAMVVSQGVPHRAFRYHASNGRTGYFDEKGHSLEKSLRRVPVKYTHVTSSFSHRRYHPISKTWQPHYGVDFGAPHGTPVYATGDGNVAAATWHGGNGKYVKIRHNSTYTTYYLHFSRFAKGIRSGARVRQGQVIGYVGSTGSATGPHVCYRIQKNGRWMNPRAIDLPTKDPVPAQEMAQFGRIRDACLIRLNETIGEGIANRTASVDRPVYPHAPQMRAPF